MLRSFYLTIYVQSSYITIMPTPSFADQMANLEDAIRRERRPLRAFPSPAPTWRQGVTDLVNAEVKHATEDFWQSVHRLGAGLLFDRYKPYEEAPARSASRTRSAPPRPAMRCRTSTCMKASGTVRGRCGCTLMGGIAPPGERAGSAWRASS